MARTRFEVYILRPAAYASVLLIVDTLVALVLLLVIPGTGLFITVANLTVFEFALLLILGGCLMGRQPLDDDKRFDDEGEPSRAWSMYLTGRDMLLTGVFIFMFGALAYLLSLIV